jgi:IS5 family transposase
MKPYIQKQRTLAMMNGFERYRRKTRRATFLEEIEQVVPWRELCALVEPYYPKPGNGRPPVGVERMLRIYFLQQWFNLSGVPIRPGFCFFPRLAEAKFRSPLLLSS